jgi:hypothetical protein
MYMVARVTETHKGIRLDAQIMPDKNGAPWMDIKGDVHQALPKLLATLQFMGVDVRKSMDYVLQAASR